jgi:hypothetical protein
MLHQKLLIFSLLDLVVVVLLVMGVLVVEVLVA